MYVCMYVCMYAYVYICVHLYTHARTNMTNLSLELSRYLSLAPAVSLSLDIVSGMYHAQLAAQGGGGKPKARNLSHASQGSPNPMSPGCASKAYFARRAAWM